MRTKLVSLAVGLILSASAVACASSQDSGDAAPAGGGGQALQEVKVGDGPYFDFVLFRVADELGLDKQLGLDLKITSSTAVPFAQLRRGDLDVIFSSPTAGFPVYKSFPQYRDFLVTGQFRGQALIGRPGKHKTYAQYLQDAGGDAKRAKAAFVQGELPGRSFCVVKSLTIATLTGLLELGNRTASDIKIVDFADDSKAANGYLSGQCDYYTGALPQVVRLLTDYKDKAVEIAPYQAFGPGADGVVFYASYATTQKWLDENPETAKKLVALWMRASRYVKDSPEKVTPLASAAVKDATGGVLSDAAVATAMSRFLLFPTPDVARDVIYNQKAPTYFRTSVQQLFDNAKKAGQIPADASFDQFQVSEKVYNQVMQDQKLVDFVNAPIG